jgi:hypothetical protein
MISAGIAHVVEPSQLIGSMPRKPSPELTSPYCALNIQRHMMPTATIDDTTGRK